MVRSRYSYISGQKMIKVLSKIGNVEIVSQKWSHIKIKFNWKKTIVPNHKEIAYWTFHEILKQIDVDEEKFLDQIS
jgi:predicted RNA binding protein YcfA (HicA-like mRNA interferase family)